MQQLFKSASWNKKQVDCCIIKRNDPDFEFIFKQRAFHWEREVAVPPDLFPKAPETTEKVWSQSVETSNMKELLCLL